MIYFYYGSREDLSPPAAIRNQVQRLRAENWALRWDVTGNIR